MDLHKDYIKHLLEKYENFNENKVIPILVYQEFIDGRKSFVVTDEISPKPLSNISDRISEIRSYFKNINKMYDLFFEDYVQLKDFLEKKQVYEKGRGAHIANRYFIHLLSSGKLFVDFSENLIKDIFDKNGLEFITFHKLASTQFDENFYYRFCYKLRNFTQHVGLPITRLVSKSNEDGDVEVNFQISLDYLINFKKSFNWGTKLRKELMEIAEYENFMYVDDILSGYIEGISELRIEYNYFLFKHFKKELREISGKLKELGFDKHRYYILSKTKKELLLSEGKFVLNPLSGIAEIFEIYKDLEQIGIVKLE